MNSLTMQDFYLWQNRVSVCFLHQSAAYSYKYWTPVNVCKHNECSCSRFHLFIFWKRTWRYSLFKNLSCELQKHLWFENICTTNSTFPGYLSQASNKNLMSIYYSNTKQKDAERSFYSPQPKNMKTNNNINNMSAFNIRNQYKIWK